jgi:hypothetical protein
VAFAGNDKTSAIKLLNLTNATKNILNVAKNISNVTQNMTNANNSQLANFDLQNALQHTSRPIQTINDSYKMMHDNNMNEIRKVRG